VVQFVLSVVLISSTIIISRQIKYINNYDLGYNQANLIYIPLTGESRSKHEAIAQEFNAISGIENITRTNRLPFYSGNSSWDFDWEGKDPDTRVLLNRMNADKNYLETMGIKIAEGSAFPESYNEVLNFEEVSSPQVILNKEALRRMGLKDPIGKYFGPTGMEKKGVIAGVVEDFNFQSLHSGVEPIFIRPLFNNPEYIIIRVNPENFSGTIEEIKKSWSVVIPQSVCEIGFFDNEIESLYNSEVKISGLFRYFSFIAIFISCIGLFGLSMFIIERRKKEIGVRKVNGAKIREVMVLLNKDFIKWVTFAFIIACPITWFVMRQWLENFAFKTNISWWVFALSGMLVLGIALLTVSWQSWRAATRNPVEALRND